MTTIGINPDCPGGIQLLADHLDTALAIGEDLQALVLAPRAELDEADPETAPEAIDLFVRRLRELEAVLLMRVLQARRRAVEIGRVDASLRVAANLFRAQTATLAELIETANGLGGTTDGLAFLRSRGLLAPEAAAPSPYESLIVTEDLRIGGVAALGILLDLVSSLLDLLDARFGLYAVLSDDAPAEALSDAAVIDTLEADDDEAVPGGVTTSADEMPGGDATGERDATVALSDAALEPTSEPQPTNLPSKIQTGLEQQV